MSVDRQLDNLLELASTPSSVNCVTILQRFGENLKRTKVTRQAELAAFITTRTVFAEFSCTSVLERVTSVEREEIISKRIPKTNLKL